MKRILIAALIVSFGYASNAQSERRDEKDHKVTVISNGNTVIINHSSDQFRTHFDQKKIRKFRKFRKFNRHYGRHVKINRTERKVRNRVRAIVRR
ncbi:MAG: hypothetical protein RIM99_07565 [Cyclobacteriaceae bacterium]